MSFPRVEEALQVAVAHHQSGRLVEAEQIYREILQNDPNCARALYLLGALANLVGQPQAGLEMIIKSLQLGLRSPDAFNHLGECYRHLKRLNEATNAYRSALQLDPMHGEAMANLGAVLIAAGQFGEASIILERAVRTHPDLVEAHFNYGLSLANIGRIDEAIVQWTSTLQLQPVHLLAMKNLARAFSKQKRFEQASSMLRILVETHPNFVPGYIDCSDALCASGNMEEALSMALGANGIAPNSAEVMSCVGRAYLRMEQCEIARDWFERSRALGWQEPSMLLALAHVYYLLNQPQKALEITDSALRLHPNNPHLKFNRSTLLLTLGNFREGFKEYEARWDCREVRHPLEYLKIPEWDGKSMVNRTLLIYDEQGFGDCIQFARYIPLAVPHFAHVIVVARHELCSLFKSIKGVTSVLPMGSRLPNFDTYIMLLSLPRFYTTSIDTIPSDTPYLAAHAADLARWHPRVDAHARGLKVGIVWGGFPSPGRKRSCSLRDLSILRDVPNVSWYSLQVDQHREQLRNTPTEMSILDLGGELKDFADTAAVISHLDLVITIDTAAAHLAGALHKNTWVMLPLAPDWRWTMKGETTMWYPSMRLFRQKTRNQWRSVIERIREELLELVKSKR